MIRCACGEDSCCIKIKLEAWPEENYVYLWFTDKDGKETLMYLDPNTVVSLIKELKEALVELM